MRNAIQHIESRTNVRFYNATGQPTVDPTYGFKYPYVNVKNNEKEPTVSSSYVGRIGGEQEMLIGSKCGVGVVVHELCHACAMYHEHCRYDRDNYITVYTENVEDNALNDVRKITSNYYTRGAFDFNSIMIYGSYTFSKNGKPTMLKKMEVRSSKMMFCLIWTEHGLIIFICHILPVLMYIENWTMLFMMEIITS